MTECSLAGSEEELEDERPAGDGCEMSPLTPSDTESEYCRSQAPDILFSPAGTTTTTQNQSRCLALRDLSEPPPTTTTTTTTSTRQHRAESDVVFVHLVSAVVSGLEEVQGREQCHCERAGVNQCVLWGLAVVAGLEEVLGREQCHCEGAGVNQCVLWDLAVGVWPAVKCLDIYVMQ
ncbi:hypothetical protein E2C01_019344 [Portunus trituberculatus]|uniref:Uncharacterized protein n=1 Tax=Portunus trituberculatus TaxID=210409 RepID=A0A5B7DXC0_PORTR|nr:hypothetical protein [Portunus trituberculatus]